jgi:hypothetical protein
MLQAGTQAGVIADSSFKTVAVTHGLLTADAMSEGTLRGGVGRTRS